MQKLVDGKFRRYVGNDLRYPYITFWLVWNADMTRHEAEPKILF